MSALGDWDKLSDTHYHHDALGVLERVYSGTANRFGWYHYPVVERGALRVAVGPYDSAEDAALATAEHKRCLKCAVARP